VRTVAASFAGWHSRWASTNVTYSKRALRLLDIGGDLPHGGFARGVAYDADVGGLHCLHCRRRVGGDNNLSRCATRLLLEAVQHVK
jgi:hypothetical protein